MDQRSNKILTIMQPTFLPWIGYFKMIAISNNFVFLDDAQFEKQSWQSRNKILINEKPNYISLNIVKNHLNSRINEIKLNNPSFFLKKILKTFSQEYSKCLHYNDGKEIFDFILLNYSDSLCQTNIKIIQFICKKLNLNNNFFLSSEMKINLKRTDKLIKICENFNTDIYLSPMGAKKYLLSDQFTNKTNVKLLFFNYWHSKYHQKSKIFQPHLSIIDLISNLGWKDAKKYLNEPYEELTDK